MIFSSFQNGMKTDNYESFFNINAFQSAAEWHFKLGGIDIIVKSTMNFSNIKN